MRVPWAIGLFGLCCSTLAQPVLQVDTIRAVQPWPPHEEYTFPRLVSAERSVQTASIDRDLALRLLDVDLDSVAHGHLFDQVWGDTITGWLPRLNYLSWQVRRPLPEVVEVEFSAEACGAYCEGFTDYLLYDLRDGAYIGDDSLFTAAGRAMLADTLKAVWFQRVSDHLVQLMVWSAALPDKAVEDTAAVGEERQMMESQIELYQRCLDERADRGPYILGMTIEPGLLRFHVARCSNHVEQALDELDPMSIALPINTVFPLIRPDRQSLFR
jgi:hypothetical protein